MDLRYPPSPLTELAIADLRRRRSSKWREYPDDVLPLWVAEMDTPLAPPVREALLTAIELGDAGYVDKGELREAYCEFALARFGWVLEPRLCSVVPDVMTGVTAVLAQVTSPGDGVVIMTPVYPPFFSYLSLAGRRIVEAPLAWSYSTGYVPDLDRIADAFAQPDVTSCLISNPHNPTGLVFSRDDLLTIGDLADRYDVRLIVDEIHSPLVYPGSVHTPLLSLVDESEAAARAFTVVSASKAWNVPGLKAAVAIAGPESASALSRVPLEVFEGTGLWGVLASEAAFRHGGPWLASVLVGLDVNRRLLGELLAEALPEIWYVAPAATYLAWLDCRELGLGDDPAKVFLDRGRVAVNGGHLFGEPGRGFVRLNFGTSPEILSEDVIRLASAL